MQKIGISLKIWHFSCKEMYFSCKEMYIRSKPALFAYKGHRKADFQSETENKSSSTLWLAWSKTSVFKDAR